MVKASNSGFFLPHNSLPSQNLNGMSAIFEPVQPGYFPACVTPVTCTIPANMTMPRIGVPSIPNLKTQQNGTQGLPQSLCEGFPQSSFPPFQNLLLAKKPYLKENISALSRAYAGAVVPNAIPGCPRKFVIFDQSGSETRLIYSSFPTAMEPTPTLTKVTDGSYLNHKEHADKMDHINLAVAELQEVWDENLLSSEESEMHEDTEEINALLCSDDDYDEDSDDDSDDDEVTSTGHSPCSIKNYGGIQGQIGELSEEVSNSDGQNKRRKLLDGGHTMSSQADIASSKRIAGVHTSDDETEPSYPIGENDQGDTISIFDNKQLKKDTVRQTLKILESIIPGVKDKDPLLVLDIAIDYLKSLKHIAKTSGLNYS
ncbi:sequence-specific DNA binding transcription factors transcription regulators [Euphorbia peplus]|nr:sequence-specific DNA binding transcription factors transcription regulators [Euphorbia peplus]